MACGSEQPVTGHSSQEGKAAVRNVADALSKEGGGRERLVVLFYSF